MLLLFASAALLDGSLVAAPQRQARATVRIERAAALRFAEIEQRAPHRLRTTELRTAEGTTQRARLVEFE